MKPLEMWGGLECTLNRVGDRFINQCDKSGHSKRLTDLQLFKNLGLKKLRYPCLWELVAPKDLDHCDWSYLDERLNEMKRLKQDFIAGFLHHGSGPLYTSLIDPDFPEKLATYARLFIQRYPWVNDFTPINEINTTARFSVLYGHWYPHLKDNSLYLKSMILQCKGTVLAMREIRCVNPKARLIQTDDIGKCQSTPELKYQSDFENERRWLTWDLLCGKVVKGHPLYQHFLENGITEKELEWFEENTCSPDVIGLNHYLLSNRYLDHRLEMFPEWSHGGNGKHLYADVGAVDTSIVENIDPEIIFKEAWNRYNISIAATECHTRGRRESQMRWLDQIWKSALKLRSEGVQFEAVTAWSLIGTFDWNNLCTENENFYEPGIFDLRNPGRTPRETAMSKMVKELAMSGEFHSPILESDGVWKTPLRVILNRTSEHNSIKLDNKARPILIIGQNSNVCQNFVRVCAERHISHEFLHSTDIDLQNRSAIEKEIELRNPWAIINTDNFGAINLARICRYKDLRMIQFSGSQDDDILSLFPSALVIRSSETIAPGDVLANECLDLLIDEERGMIHLSDEGEISRELFTLMEVFGRQSMEQEEIRS